MNLHSQETFKSMAYTLNIHNYKYDKEKLSLIWTFAMGISILKNLLYLVLIFIQDMIL